MKSIPRKTNLLWIAYLAALLILAARPACGQQSQPIAPKVQSPTPKTPAQPASTASPAKALEFKPDQVILKIGDREVTVADLEAAMQGVPAQARGQRKPIVDQLILLEVLAQQAVKQHLDDSPEFRRQMNLARTRWLAQAEYRNIGSEAKVSEQEINQYYSAHPADFEQVDIRQVSLRKKPAGAPASAPGLTDEEAKAKAEEIRKSLTAHIDPKKIAEDFKMPNIIHIDTEIRTVRHGQLPKAQEEDVFKTKEGEFSPAADDAQSLSFTQVIKHEQAPLNDVTREIEVKLRGQKITDSLDNLKKAAKVWMDPEYFGPPAPAPAAAPAATTPPASESKPPVAAPKPPANPKTSP